MRKSLLVCGLFAVTVLCVPLVSAGTITTWSLGPNNVCQPPNDATATCTFIFSAVAEDLGSGDFNVKFQLTDITGGKAFGYLGSWSMKLFTADVTGGNNPVLLSGGGGGLTSIYSLYDNNHAANSGACQNNNNAHGELCIGLTSGTGAFVTPGTTLTFDLGTVHTSGMVYTAGDGRIMANVYSASGPSGTKYVALSTQSLGTVPEPASLALLSVGLIGLGGLFKRHK